VKLEGACGAERGRQEKDRDIHSKLREQKEKQNSTEQNQNNTEAEQEQSATTVHTNTSDRTQTFSKCFSVVVSWPHSVDSGRTVDTSMMWRCKEHCVLATFCGQPQDSGHINHVALQGQQLRTDGWLRLALCSSHHKHQKRKGGGGPKCFWMRPTLRKLKAHGADKLLVDLRNYGVGLCGYLQSSLEFSFQNLRRSFREFDMSCWSGC
jgi:hypothetical protein